MFKLLRSEKLELFWFVFHAALGFACVRSKTPLIIWFYISCVGFIISIMSGKKSQLNLVTFLVYLLGFEVLGRGVSAAPYIPHEVGKYTAFFGFLLGLVLGGPIKRFSVYGIFLLVLSFPAIMIMPKYNVKDIVFNYLGPAALFLGVIFCNKQVFTYSELKGALRAMVYSIFSLACYVVFRANTFEKIKYSLTASFEASGGSISNQVSTLLGTGICIIVVMYITGQGLFKYKWMDISLLVLFLVRGLLTFSRGGMLSAILAIFLIIVMPKAKAAWQDHQIKLRKVSWGALLSISIVMACSFYFVNLLTDNYLLYRYQGRTANSLKSGFTDKIDLNQMTSGRVNIMYSDFRMFMAYPALGVGVGQSRWLRTQYGESYEFASHLEFSRLLAEHGMLGVILVIMLYFYPFFKVMHEPNNYKRVLMMAFLIMALSATFHNAMRTMITPILFALSFINIVPDDYDWREHLRQRKRFTPLALASEPAAAPAMAT